jgi:hypothetical protein
MFLKIFVRTWVVLSRFNLICGAVILKDDHSKDRLSLFQRYLHDQHGFRCAPCDAEKRGAMSMIEFDYGNEAELFSPRSRTSNPRARYQRFARAADAIRFAIEELPPELLLGTYLEVEEERFDRGGIRLLYDNAAYPLARRAAAARPKNPVGRRSHAVTLADKITNDTAPMREAGLTEAINTSRHRGAT